VHTQTHPRNLPHALCQKLGPHNFHRVDRFGFGHQIGALPCNVLRIDLSPVNMLGLQAMDLHDMRESNAPCERWFIFALCLVLRAHELTAHNDCMRYRYGLFVGRFFIQFIVLGAHVPPPYVHAHSA